MFGVTPVEKVRSLVINSVNSANKDRSTPSDFNFTCYDDVLMPGII